MTPHQALKIDMTQMYRSHPLLKQVEMGGRHRLTKRRHILQLVPEGKIGAEIGVYTGMFAEVLDRDLSPKKLYLIDPWHLLHGECYPNWGGYSANVALPTKAALDAVTFRAEKFDSDCVVVQAFAEDWLSDNRSLQLDWAYVDGSHNYDEVLELLMSLDKVVARNGIIIGDDCWVTKDGKMSEVFYAIRDFTRKKNYQFIRMDGHGQWAITRILDNAKPGQATS